MEINGHDEVTGEEIDQTMSSREYHEEEYQAGVL